LYKILEYICEHSPGNIQLNTNAGLRTPETYTAIGNLFAQKSTHEGKKLRRVVTFSIDGLEDTNHIYRRNVTWKKVWNNLMAYVSTGAEAHWDFLQFKHNVHQVEEARALAEKYGINFVLKNPFGVDKISMPVYNRDLKLDYLIEHAFDNGYPTYIPASGDYTAPMPEPIKASGCIDCMAKRTAQSPYDKKEIVEIYINALGQVLPCCFVGHQTFVKHMPSGVQVQKIQRDMNNANSLHHYSLKEILDNQVLDVWSDSWENKTIAVCWNQCGKSDNKARAIDILFKDSK
jgi:MoaA/NifB/PqqE/SkfB family radical SAM enzyme